MENNKLSIYREVLTFPCDILNLQEKIDQLITISKLCEYNISCKLLTDHNYVDYLRFKVSKNDLIEFVIDFDYDFENEYIDKIYFYYPETNNEQDRRILGNEIKEIVEELDKLMGVI